MQQGIMRQLTFNTILCSRLPKASFFFFLNDRPPPKFSPLPHPAAFPTPPGGGPVDPHGRAGPAPPRSRPPPPRAPRLRQPAARHLVGERRQREPVRQHHLPRVERRPD